MIRAPRFRTDSNDSRSAVPNWLKWLALRGPELNVKFYDWNFERRLLTKDAFDQNDSKIVKYFLQFQITVFYVNIY